MSADSQYIKSGKCPCGCKRGVPSGRYFFDTNCRRRANYRGIHMPNRYEKKLRMLKRK